VRRPEAKGRNDVRATCTPTTHTTHATNAEMTNLCVIILVPHVVDDTASTPHHKRTHTLRTNTNRRIPPSEGTFGQQSAALPNVNSKLRSGKWPAGAANAILHQQGQSNNIVPGIFMVVSIGFRSVDVSGAQNITYRSIYSNKLQVRLNSLRCMLVHPRLILIFVQLARSRR
jgi:hypothetical protein